MKEDLNTISKEELEEGRINNLLPDYKQSDSDGGKEDLKDRVGIWTEAQIAENPLAYIEHLRRLMNSRYNQRDITKINLEIKRVKAKYLPNEYASGRNR